MRIRPASFILAAILGLTLAPQFAAATQTPAFSPAQRQVLATIHRLLDGINRSDLKEVTGACASQTAIIDEFAPHVWHGTAACGQWFHDFTAANHEEGIAAGTASMGPPTQVQVSGSTAYVVAPASYAYQRHGKAVTESGATFTVALQRTGGRWLITGWAWSAR